MLGLSVICISIVQRSLSLTASQQTNHNSNGSKDLNGAGATLRSPIGPEGSPHARGHPLKLLNSDKYAFLFKKKKVDHLCEGRGALEERAMDRTRHWVLPKYVFHEK